MRQMHNACRNLQMLAGKIIYFFKKMFVYCATVSIVPQLWPFFIFTLRGTLSLAQFSMLDFNILMA